MATKDDTYFFHQTPSELATDLISTLPLTQDDILYEPFRGEGAFYNAFPETNYRLYTEITEGLDYRNMTEPYDWVITNPPFRLDRDDGKRTNAVWELCSYYADRANKGIAFLINTQCVLTPIRFEYMRKKGFILTQLIMCSIKKWRGRYYWMVFEKKETEPCMKYLTKNY